MWLTIITGVATNIQEWVCIAAKGEMYAAEAKGRRVVADYLDIRTLGDSGNILLLLFRDLLFVF